MRRAHKYGAKATTVDGIRFASKKEAKRYGELKLLERAGHIWGLELQPRYPLTVNGVKVATYVGDFRYYAVDANDVSRLTVEDVKGVRTPMYRLKKKFVQAQHGVLVVEV